ncbi:hypothetical protein THAOC_03840 [Thalassiosira oceanica]|uniref:Uncharacterized protein n=1 Tax=Thalassiosira oceanica TaxID=159749 RepID=K0TPH7_THAOC|nr:hypothetical protein THAOC_03840 [Thalassiosira oceanica]|eukprot:EJK74482.1 hypothetical protein THAOC_03840 [Thalassiosira oceanica]
MSSRSVAWSPNERRDLISSHPRGAPGADASERILDIPQIQHTASEAGLIEEYQALRRLDPFIEDTIMPTRPAVLQQGPRRTLHWGDQPRRQTAPPRSQSLHQTLATRPDLPQLPFRPSARKPLSPFKDRPQVRKPTSHSAPLPTTPHRLYQGNATSHDTSLVTPTRHPHPMRTFPPEIRTT